MATAIVMIPRITTIAITTPLTLGESAPSVEELLPDAADAAVSACALEFRLDSEEEEVELLLAVELEELLVELADLEEVATGTCEQHASSPFLIQYSRASELVNRPKYIGVCVCVRF